MLAFAILFDKNFLIPENNKKHNFFTISLSSSGNIDKILPDAYNRQKTKI